MFILLITAAVNAPHPLSDLKKWHPKLLKKITVRKIFVVRFFFKEMTIVYRTQYSKIVIEVKYLS
jgi:hypothetical protein